MPELYYFECMIYQSNAHYQIYIMAVDESRARELIYRMFAKSPDTPIVVIEEKYSVLPPASVSLLK